jgi:hypothetical protein
MDHINKEGLEQYLLNGAYIRGLKMPHGTIIRSQHWIVPRLWIVTYGDFTFYNETTETRLKGPLTYTPPLGTIELIAHQDTQIFAITGTVAENLDEVASEVIKWHGE